MQDNPFKSADNAVSSGKPICKACRKLAGIPPKAINKCIFEPYVLYEAFRGELTVFSVVGETNANYRLDSGELKPKHNRSEDLYWIRAGDKAGYSFYSKNKDEAVAMAKDQIQQRIDYLTTLIDDAKKLSEHLG